MKKITLCLFILVAFNVVINAQDVRVGVVNGYSIVDKLVEKELKSFMASKQNEINLMLARYNRELKYLQENANSMSEDARRTKWDEVQKLRARMEQKTADSQKLISARRDSLVKSAGERILILARKIGAENGFDLVFSSDTSPLFKSNRINVVDITDEVLRRYYADK